MDAAVSLHHAALSAASSLPPPPHHHRALPLPPPLLHVRHPSARLAVTAARPRAVPRSSSPAPVVSTHSSSRAATGYAAALADASLRAGTLRRASRHARALLRGRHLEKLEDDARVGALVRMLVGKGKAGMVAEVMAKFAAICDRLLPLPTPAPPPPSAIRALVSMSMGLV